MAQNDHNIILINPNPIRPAIPPIGLEYLYEYLLRHGIQAHLYDFGVDGDQSLVTLIDALDPSVIGISVRNIDDGHIFHKRSYLTHIKDLVFRIRMHTNAKICLGGVGYSIMPESILKFTQADFGIVGEGERSFLDLLNNISHPEDVANLVYFNHGEIRVSSKTVDFLDSGQLNLKRVSLQYEKYLDGGSIFNIQTLRGCNRNCLFCSEPEVLGKKLRFRDPLSVVEEMHRLKELGVVSKLYFVDSEYNVSNAHAQKMAEEIIASGLKVSWNCYMNPLGVDRDLIRAVKMAGCDMIVWGVEAASDSMLQSLQKDFLVEDIFRVDQLCRAAEQKFAFTLLFGGPGECEKTISESYRAIRNMHADHLFISCGIRIFPRTDLYQRAISDGNLDKKQDLIEPVYYNEHYIRDVVYPEVTKLFSPLENATILGPNCSTPYVDAEFQKKLQCSSSLEEAFQRDK